MSRSAEFALGVTPGVQTDYWANQRYGDREQLPAAPVRRAGPFGPDTLHEHLEWERERTRSQSD